MKAVPNRRRFLGKMLLGSIAATAIPNVSFASKKRNSSQTALRKIKSGSPFSEEYWKFIRTQFLLSPNKHYFNTASLGASPRLVIDTMYDWTVKLEKMGESMQDRIGETREKAAELLNCEVDELAITGNTTEGINIVAQSIKFKKGDEIVVTDHAHIGGAAPWLALKNNADLKIDVKLAELNSNGLNNLEQIKKKITSKTKVVVVSHVTCTTGMVLPIKEIIAYCRSKGIMTCIDGAHPLGMMKVDLKELNPDFYATSGHKWLLGPKGTGFLFINKNTIQELKPIHAGAYAGIDYDLENLKFEHNQKTHRIELGTRSTPTAMALGAAIDFVNAIGIENIEARGKALAKYLKEELVKIPKVEVLTPFDEQYSASIVTFSVKGMEFEQLQTLIQIPKEDNAGVMRKFRVRGIHENNLNGIRISCAIYNSYEEMDRLLNLLKSIVAG